MTTPEEEYNSKKHITFSDIFWSTFWICVGFLMLYIFYLLFSDIKNSTLYQEILRS
jgi:hypothetical protein